MVSYTRKRHQASLDDPLKLSTSDINPGPDPNGQGHCRSSISVSRAFHSVLEKFKRKGSSDSTSSINLPLSDETDEANHESNSDYGEPNDVLIAPEQPEELVRPRGCRRSSLGSLQDYAQDRLLRVNKANRMSFDELMARSSRPAGFSLGSNEFVEFSSHRDLSKVVDLRWILSDPLRLED
eukprot:CAMPEP_0117670724 /NCGR_PEP_ID=MMETSP0804-20121206/12931_1 /TAXON_ID=1074897 /ORGANISM="Tetraselmis astigmatica, Strain CCMP880" /LENGTH=180 /DNA_ID=CAMNT_0005479093 /DNA_START=270 /DNA_END=812 /DNA_ORIENTATION=-